MQYANQVNGFPSPCGELRVADSPSMGLCGKFMGLTVSVPLRGIEGS